MVSWFTREVGGVRLRGSGTYGRMRMMAGAGVVWGRGTGRRVGVEVVCDFMIEWNGSFTPREINVYRPIRELCYGEL